MHDFIRRFGNGAFYPAEVQILFAAFDEAWARLQSSGAPFAEEAYAAAAREILAKHIIMAAQKGERNPRQLTEDALFHLARQPLIKKPPAFATEARVHDRPSTQDMSPDVDTSRPRSP